MKARITHLKAPWPEGVGVGDVVAFEGDTVPAWAVGKCERVGDDVEVTVAEAEKPKADSAGAAKKKPA